MSAEERLTERGVFAGRHGLRQPAIKTEGSAVSRDEARAVLREVGRAIFLKVEPACYEYGGTGYRVERMANGKWDAYLPGGHGLAYRLWESTHHRTRNEAAAAISLHRRWLAKQINSAASSSDTKVGQ